MGVKPQLPVNHIDIFTTVAAATGAKIPTDRPMDGINLLPQIAKPADKGPDRSLFWRTDTYRVIRKGDWKLQVTQNPRKDWLYHLATDPTEKVNLATQEPARVASMKKELEAYLSDIFSFYIKENKALSLLIKQSDVVDQSNFWHGNGMDTLTTSIESTQ